MKGACPFDEGCAPLWWKVLVHFGWVLMRARPFGKGALPKVSQWTLTYWFSIQYPDGVVQVVSTNTLLLLVAILIFLLDSFDKDLNCNCMVLFFPKTENSVYLQCIISSKKYYFLVSGLVSSQLNYYTFLLGETVDGSFAEWIPGDKYFVEDRLIPMRYPLYSVRTVFE
jgi:hypothetical protein